MTTICVIVPIYKVEKYLQRCIDSILNQTFTDFKLILVDDGSPDNCPSICDEYAKKDKRIVVIHQDNGGLSAARNAGLDWIRDHSKCEWITFVDSDDWIHPMFLEIMFNAVQNTGTLLSICSHKPTGNFEIKFDDIIPKVINKDSESAYIDLSISSMPAWAKLYHYSLWENERFVINKLHEDAFITHKLIFSAKNVAAVHEKLYYYFLSDESIMRKTWSFRRLDEIEGRKVRLKYLQENGYTRAYEKELNSTLWVFFEQLKQIPKTFKFYKYRKMVKKELLKHLKKCGFLTFKQRLFFYRILFPIIFWIPYRISIIKHNTY